MKKWEKPQLIVLVRNRPEEAVLGPCKGQAYGGPKFDYGYCFDFIVGLGCGNTCSSTAAS